MIRSMSDESHPQEGGAMLWVPDGAFVVFPIDDVVAMFEHKDASVTRSLMGKHGYPRMIRGYGVDEVNEVMEKLDPIMLERWRNRRAAEAARKRRTGNG